MKPLRVAVFVKNRVAAREREQRSMGMWSYPVPQFTWDFLSPGKAFDIDLRQMQSQGYDLIFHEDGGNWGGFRNRKIPVIYYSIDSTLTEENHYKPRLEQAGKSDLVLLDHDQPERFDGIRKPVQQLPYCVNDRVFYPGKQVRTAEVVFHCNSDSQDDTRAKIRAALAEICEFKGWRYRSGAMGLQEYAESIRRARVVVNWPRTRLNRPHRVLDTMASQSCLLTGALPEVRGEMRLPGHHYAMINTIDQLEWGLVKLLDDGEWFDIAAAGYDLVREHHTWSVRAEQLRQLISDCLGV